MSSASGRAPLRTGRTATPCVARWISCKCKYVVRSQLISLMTESMTSRLKCTPAVGALSKLRILICITYSATELKCTMKKVEYFPREIERMAFVPFDRYGSRASKNGRKSFRSPPIRRKVLLAAQGAKKGPFCMGILVTLSLSKKKAPIGRKKYFC